MDRLTWSSHESADSDDEKDHLGIFENVMVFIKQPLTTIGCAWLRNRAWGASILQASLP
jgi:hypothetical protein